MRSRHTRRDILGAAGAGLAAASPLSRALAQSTAPELVVINARVWTVDDRLPKAQAFAVRGGRFLAVGSNEDVRSLVGKGTEVFDAKGMTVTPGFIDCHNHASGQTLLYEVLVGNPYEVEFVTIDSIVEKLKARAATTPAEVTVIRDGQEKTFQITPHYSAEDKRMLMGVAWT